MDKDRIKSLVTAYTKNPEYKRKYRNMHFIPLPTETRWKALILAMKSGEWMTIAYISSLTGFKRRRIKNLLKAGIKAGIIQKDFEYYYQDVRKDITKRGWKPIQDDPSAWLLRTKAYYRLRMDKIKIEIK